MDVRASSKAGVGAKVQGVPSTNSGQALRLRKAIRFADRRAPLRMTKPAGALLLMLILSAGARAATYYVSSSAGNDSNNGTSVSTPWQTIGHVNGQTFSPGDSILFKRGDVWNEGLATASSGSSGNPITFDAYGTGAAPNLTGYYSVPSSAWVHVTGNAWKAPVPATYTAINFCLFGSVWGEKVAAVSSNLTAWGDFYLASGFVYVFSPENPASYYVGAIVPMGLSNVPVINVNGQSWLTFQHLLVNWFDQYGVYVQGASDHLVFANMEADSMIPQGTQPLGFYVDENAPGPGDIKIYNSEAHLNYDAFRFDGTAVAITMVNDKAYGNRDGALVDNTGAVSYSYCHFYASSLAVAGSTDVEYTSGSGPTAGAGNIATDTAPAVQVYQRYPAEVTLTVDDAGMTPGADSYYAGTVLPIADAAGVPVGAAITVGYPLAQTLVSEFQGWVNSGRDVTSHSMSHTYYTNVDALDVQYTGTGTAATLSISGKTLTITVTGASDSVSYNLAQGQTQGTILGLQQALAATGKFTTSYLTPCQGPYGTGCSAYTAAALLAQDLADVSGEDVRSAVYHLQLDVTRLTTDEIMLSRQWMTTNLTGLPATPVYVYPGGYETTTMQGITQSVPYSGARGALKEDLGVKDTYADGFNVQNITSFGVNPSWMGLAPATLNQKIQALVWKESVWGVPWGIFWHWNATTGAGELSATEVTNLIADFKASGATIQANTGLVNWLLGGTQESGADGNYYYTFPATSTTLDFRPTKNSPVVDAGQNLGSAYALDLNGVNQNSYGSGWEIGAHVYQGFAEYGTGAGSSRFTVGTAGHYYVSTTGNDSNSCLSSGAPCQTIAHAESLSAAGDTINIGAGTYRLTTALNSTGGVIQAKNNQTFTGPACAPTSAACAAIISGSIQLCTGSYTCSGPDGNGNWSVTGMTQAGAVTNYLCDPGWPGCNYPEDLFLNGTPLQHLSSAVAVAGFTGTSGTLTFTALNNAVAGETIALAGFTSPNTGLNGQTVTVLSAGLTGLAFEATVTGSGYSSGAGTGTITNITSFITSAGWWFDYTNDIIYFHTNPSGQTVETSVLATAFVRNGINTVTVENLTVEEFAAPLQQGAISPTASGSSTPAFGANWIVQNDYVTLNHGFGVFAQYGGQILNNVEIANGQFGMNGYYAPGISTTQSNILMQGNTVTSNNYAHVSPSFGGGGINFGNTAGAVVRGNTVSGNLGLGIHFDVNSVNNLIDGNTVENNADPAATGGSGAGIHCEISTGCTIRNNTVVHGVNGSSGVLIHSSSQVQAYCNVIEETSGSNYLWQVLAIDRGDNTVPPNQGAYTVANGNSVHHNTLIWAAGTTGQVGYFQNDTTNQPSFFANNTPPDYNTYHGPSTGITQFVYDNNNSGSNTAANFTTYQGNGADVHGTIDTVNTSSFPIVTITSPVDQSTVTNPVTITASASDSSGISKVEFYVDWTLQATVTSGPYNYSWAAASGTHTIAAMAFSNAGVQTCNAVTLTGPPS
jgi:parallel beta-helix repeat protein